MKHEQYIASGIRLKLRPTKNYTGLLARLLAVLQTVYEQKYISLVQCVHCTGPAFFTLV